MADKAYATGVVRTDLRRPRIKAVVPPKSDHLAARARRRSAGGRPHACDAETYQGRNVVERSFARAKHWRELATRYDKLAITYRAAVTILATITGYAPKKTRPHRCPGAG